MYVVDDCGVRIACPHPGESEIIERVLGPDAPRELIKARTGFNSDCVCLDCLQQFQADLGHQSRSLLENASCTCLTRIANMASPDKDDRLCPKCGSENVRTLREMIGERCPACGVGTIQEISTGWEA